MLPLSQSTKLPVPFSKPLLIEAPLREEHPGSSSSDSDSDICSPRPSVKRSSAISPLEVMSEALAGRMTDLPAFGLNPSIVSGFPASSSTLRPDLIRCVT